MVVRTIVRLTSRWESPYFPKLDSSFCQIGPHDSHYSPDFRLVLKLLYLVNGWICQSGMTRSRRNVILIGAVVRCVALCLFENLARHGRMRKPRMVYMKQ